MAEQERRPVSTGEETSQVTNANQRAAQTMSEVSASVAMLRTEADRARGLFGFGRRILVPPDEIHVVVGDGRHVVSLGNERKVFGQSANQPARYWLNAHTQVIKLKTISFNVPLRGSHNDGIAALDSSKVSFRLWAHAVAKLNPDKAEVAAQRVGLDTSGLVSTISKVGTAELIAAAATMSLDEIIANRQRLAEIAFPKVNQILSELGYDLALLTVTQLDGEAYIKLVQQAESRISKETSVATNREQLAELQDDQGRRRMEAEIQAMTEKKLAAERLDAHREVETATIAQEESLEIRRHEMRLEQIGREKAAAEKDHDASLKKVEIGRQLGEAEAERNASLARLQSEREAELKAVQQQRTAAIRLAETKAEADRMAMEQERHIERAGRLTEAEAERLRREELALADRAKEVALIEAEQMSRSMKIEAEAETQAELVRAQAEAEATEKRAQAAKIRAEATRAEAAAAGLAEAEVAEAQVAVSEKRVAVARAEAMAEAEKIQKLKEVEISAQKELALLYEQAPVLIEMEQLRMRLSHEEALARIQAEASLKAFEAIAPGVKIHLFGNGGQTGQILSSLMTLSHGLTAVSEESPLLGSLLAGQTSNGHFNWNRLATPVETLMPALKQLTNEVNPRILSGLKVADVVERLGPVVAGKENLVTALNQIKEDATFRVIGDLPLGGLLKMMGLTQDNGGPLPVADIAVEDGSKAELMAA
jgi:hypothetical protein